MKSHVSGPLIRTQSKGNITLKNLVAHGVYPLQLSTAHPFFTSDGVVCQ